jgi:hypothetical protein
MAITTQAMSNAGKISALREHGKFHGRDIVEIYRTHTSGTASGRLHADVLIGYLRFLA